MDAIGRERTFSGSALERLELCRLLASGDANELAAVALFEELQSEIGLATQVWRKGVRILKVVLYGCHACGDGVDDPAGGYKAGYDIPVAGNDVRQADPVGYWAKADNRLIRWVSATRTVRAFG